MSAQFPSSSLQNKFKLVEMAAFDEWRSASTEKKNEICKNIGEWEAKEIIKEINNSIDKSNQV